MAEQWHAGEIPSQSGLRYIITGGNSGIGYQAALKLARKGAEVVVACRDQGRGAAAVARLRHEAPGGHVEPVPPADQVEHASGCRRSRRPRQLHRRRRADV